MSAFTREKNEEKLQIHNFLEENIEKNVFYIL